MRFHWFLYLKGENPEARTFPRRLRRESCVERTIPTPGAWTEHPGGEASAPRVPPSVLLLLLRGIFLRWARSRCAKSALTTSLCWSPEDSNQPRQGVPPLGGHQRGPIPIPPPQTVGGTSESAPSSSSSSSGSLGAMMVANTVSSETASGDGGRKM